MSLNSLKGSFYRYYLNFKYVFRPSKPLLMMRIAKAYLSILLFNKTPLRYVDFAIDFKCNLRCAHCSAALLMQDKEKMDIKDYERVAAQCRELGAINLAVTGGEPLLHPQLLDILRTFKPHKTIVSLTTNGTLLSEDYAKRLRGAGVDIVGISIDSFNPEFHDKFRGMRGCLERALKGINNAKKAGINVLVGTVVSHQNVRSDDLLNTIKKTQELGVIMLLGLAVPIGRWTGNEGILLTKEDWKYIQELERKYPHIRTDFENNFRGYGCGAMIEKLYVTPYGDVTPCPFIQVSFGNIFKESVEEIRKKGLKNRIFTAYSKVCPAALDKDFIKNHIYPIYEEKDIPVPHTKVGL